MSISVAKWCYQAETFFWVRQLPPVAASLRANCSDVDEQRKNSGVFALILQTFNSLETNEPSLRVSLSLSPCIVSRQSDMETIFQVVRSEQRMMNTASQGGLGGFLTLPLMCKGKTWRLLEQRLMTLLYVPRCLPHFCFHACRYKFFMNAPAGLCLRNQCLCYVSCKATPD